MWCVHVISGRGVLPKIFHLKDRKSQVASLDLRESRFSKLPVRLLGIQPITYAWSLCHIGIGVLSFVGSNDWIGGRVPLDPHGQLVAGQMTC